jgi:hypothetical protein
MGEEASFTGRLECSLSEVLVDFFVKVHSQLLARLGFAKTTSIETLRLKHKPLLFPLESVELAATDNIALH